MLIDVSTKEIQLYIKDTILLDSMLQTNKIYVFKYSIIGASMLSIICLPVCICVTVLLFDAMLCCESAVCRLSVWDRWTAAKRCEIY